MNETWRTVRHREGMTDPVRDFYAGRGMQPDLEEIRRRYPATTGEPAIDPDEVRRRAMALKTVPEIRTGVDHLDLSVRVGLASIDLTFDGDHPKYGVRHYAETRHDGFPPTIISAVDALSAWGLCERAQQLFDAWLTEFVRSDGTIRYYGPSISEYGQLLYTAALLYERGGPASWWNRGRTALDRIARHLLDLCAEAERISDLIPGVPEADVSSGEPLHVVRDGHSESNRYFHNNSWVARGLQRWASLLDAAGAVSTESPDRIRAAARILGQRTLEAIGETWPSEGEAFWLSPQVEPCSDPKNLTANGMASYTNYRYWPELLSSGLLPPDLAHRVVDARLSAGGQFCGMTRFSGHLDDWPLAEYLFGLWRLGRRNDFLLSLFGHVAYHQAEGHLTAYEQVTLPPGREKAPYCLPCQLVAARTARLLVG